MAYRPEVECELPELFQSASRELAFTCDVSGVVTWADPRAQRLLSLQAGTRFDRHSAPGTEDKVARLLAAGGLKQELGWELALIVSGKPATAVFSAAPHQGGVAFLGSLVPDDYGAIVGQVTSAMAEIVTLSRDTARQKKELEQRHLEVVALNRSLEDSILAVRAMHAELEDRADALRRSVDVRGRVVSHVSHEFRTPLNAISALSRLLLAESDNPLTGEPRKQVGFISQGAEQLSLMVNDLLDLSKLEAGKVPVRPEKFFVTELFGALRGMLAPLLRKDTGVLLVFEEPAPDHLLETDLSKVSQVMRNLISNALKFTQRGEIRISAAREPDGSTALIVRDTGLGIAPDNQDRIFEEFEQIAGPTQARARGTGLGLSISRRIATILGGTLTVESALEQGAAFSLRLPPISHKAKPAPVVGDGQSALLLYEPPVKPGDFELVPARTPAQESLTLQAITVLNVDDNAARLYLTSRMLLGGGLRVLEAADGVSAIELARSQRPDVILLDVKLPDMSGFDVCRILKASEATASCSILMTSAYLVDSGSKVVGLGLGADAYLVQPFEAEELLAMINSLLRLRQAEQESHQRNTQLLEADRHKDEFVATLAHELRNPLAAATMALQVMDLLPADPTRERRARGVVARQLSVLGRLIDDLLDVSRVTRGKIDLRRETVDFGALVERAAASAREHWMGPRGQELSVAVPDARVDVIGDPLRLEQVLNNLLDNACKYSERGGRIALHLSTNLVEGGCTLSLRDDGLGLTPDSTGKVFGLFFQADQRLPRARAGLGIGLTLVRTLVELHGGTVTARSEGLGRGSEFQVRLPLAPTATGALKA